MPYRAPELFDVKTGAVLDEKVDIWVRPVSVHTREKQLRASRLAVLFSLLRTVIPHSRSMGNLLQWR